MPPLGRVVDGVVGGDGGRRPSDGCRPTAARRGPPRGRVAGGRRSGAAQGARHPGVVVPALLDMDLRAASDLWRGASPCGPGRHRVARCARVGGPGAQVHPVRRRRGAATRTTRRQGIRPAAVGTPGIPGGRRRPPPGLTRPRGARWQHGRRTRRSRRAQSDDSCISGCSTGYATRGRWRRVWTCTRPRCGPCCAGPTCSPRSAVCCRPRTWTTSNGSSRPDKTTHARGPAPSVPDDSGTPRPSGSSSSFRTWKART